MVAFLALTSYLPWCRMLDTSIYFCIRGSLYHFDGMLKSQLKVFWFRLSLAWCFPQISQVSGSYYPVLVIPKSAWSWLLRQQPDPPGMNLFTTSGAQQQLWTAPSRIDIRRFFLLRMKYNFLRSWMAIEAVLKLMSKFAIAEGNFFF